MSLVRRGHFRSRDEDVGRKPHAARKLHGSIYYYRAGLIAHRKFYIAEIRIFALFCSCDLDLDLMTFIYELDPYSPKMHQKTKRELFTSRLSKVIILQTDIQTYRQTDAAENATTPLRGW